MELLLYLCAFIVVYIILDLRYCIVVFVTIFNSFYFEDGKLLFSFYVSVFYLTATNTVLKVTVTEIRLIKSIF